MKDKNNKTQSPKKGTPPNRLDKKKLTDGERAIRHFDLLLKVILAVSALFTAFCVPIRADVSILALLFGVAIIGLCAFSFLRARWLMLLKALQYLPYALLLSFITLRAGAAGRPYWLDFLQVALWCVVFFTRMVAVHTLNTDSAHPVAAKSPLSKNLTPRRILIEIADWADALVQAVFMVLLIQIFIFQLYVIPSESMVPSFLVGDRVVVTKFTGAPRFPLSDVGLPPIKTYKRGDVVVFRNPHYTIDRNSEVKGVLSQIIYMLTLTTVNLNKDERGEVKYDPLVKRICGVPGERLMMQDGVLYRSTIDSKKFTRVKEDEKFARWDLNGESPAIKSKIREFPLGRGQYSHYKSILAVEAARRALNTQEAKSTCRALSLAFSALAKKSEGKSAPFALDLNCDTLFFDYKKNVALLLQNDAWFKSFLCDWIDKTELAQKAYLEGVDTALAEDEISDEVPDTLDLYKTARYKLNLLSKLSVGKLYLRYAELLQKKATAEEVARDEALMTALFEAEELAFYIQTQDQRNLCIFPPDREGAHQYIARDHFFMMGDNRYNSLDMRHSYSQQSQKLTDFDDYSIVYKTNLEPRAVDKKWILGSALVRFWPLGRVGAVKTK